MHLYMYIFLLFWAHDVLGFQTTRTQLSMKFPALRRPTLPIMLSTAFEPLRSKDGDSEEETEKDAPGMTDAFRQLDALDSLELDSQQSVPPAKKIEKTEDITSPGPLSIEEEAETYTKIAKQVENKSEEDLYDDMIEDMGGIAVPKVAPEPKDIPSFEKPDEFMEKALEEAIKEVSLNNPDISKSVLDDKEIMKEIEAIFDKGNEKLIASLEEVRQEQKQLAKESADQSAKAASDNVGNEAERLAQAESSMAAMLEKVSKETAGVQAAVDDLRDEQSKIDDNVFLKLRSGGVVKQGALVGVLLFSVRSILDSVSAVGGEGGMMTPALVQALIALVCAAAYFFL